MVITFVSTVVLAQRGEAREECRKGFYVFVLMSDSSLTARFSGSDVSQWRR
jgi:hypothetical protein